MLSLIIILLPSETAVIKNEAHTKRTEPEYQENAQLTLIQRQPAKESIKTVAHVDNIHSAAAKMSPHCEIFGILMSV